MGVAVVELRHGPLHARVLPALGGALGSFDIERAGSRQNLLRPAPDDADDPLQTACFPMAPFCGRIYADGFARWLRECEPREVGVGRPRRRVRAVRSGGMAEALRGTP